MIGRTCSVRICMVGLIVVCFMVLATSAELVSATEVYNEDDYSIPAYEVRYFSVYLAEGAGMAGWFRINNGDGIRFFIVDEFGHNEIQSTGSTTTACKVGHYPMAEGNWYYWNFVAPDTDTWHIYFSNAFGTAYAGAGDELDIIIRTNTEAPSIHTDTLNKDMEFAKRRGYDVPLGLVTKKTHSKLRKKICLELGSGLVSSPKAVGGM